MKTLNFEIEINASKAKVWDKVTNLKSYEEWTGAAFPGSTFEGSWTEGGKIDFFGPGGSGTQVTVQRIVENEAIELAHTAMLTDGRVPDTESDFAKNWIGIKENYYFSENNGVTTFKVMAETGEEWESMFTESWPKMLAKLKEICES